MRHREGTVMTPPTTIAVTGDNPYDITIGRGMVLMG